MAAIWLITAMLILIFAPVEYQESLDRRAVRTAQMVLAFASVMPDRVVQQPTLDDVLSDKLELEEFLIVIRRDGHPIYSSLAGGLRLDITLPLDGTARIGSETYDLFGLEDRATRTEVIVGVSKAEAFFASVEIAGLAIGLLTIAMFFVLSAVRMGIRSGLEPLDSFAKNVEQRDGRDLTPLGTEATPIEMKPIAMALNGFMGRLKQVMDQEREFISNAAHELRTPLTAIRAQVEQIDPDPEHPTESQAIGNVMIAIDRADRLVHQLLDLSRSQSANLGHMPETRFDLAVHLQELMADLVPIAEKRQVELSLDAPDNLFTRCQQDLLRVILRNLLENAIKYSSEQGLVAVSVRQADNGRLKIDVHDNGPGLTPEEFERAGDRFQRLGRTDRQGAGLGLAIVFELCEKLGFTLTRISKPTLGGLSLELDIPGPH